MGVRLYVEVLDHAPAAVKGSELVVLLVIAEDARDATRESWLGMAKLKRRSRCGESTVRGHLAKLEQRKLITRLDAPTVQPGAAPVVAHRGHSTVYRIEPMPGMADSSHTEAPGSQRLSGAKGARIPAERGQDPSEKAPGSRPPIPHAPAGPLIERAADIGADVVAAVRETLAERTGRDVGDAWARQVAASLLVGRRGVSAPARWIRTVIQRETNLQRFLPVPEV